MCIKDVNRLTQVHLEKWPLKLSVCVCVCVCVGSGRCRYDPELARFEDPPSVTKSDDEATFKFCSSCVRIRQKQLVM